MFWETLKKIIFMLTVLFIITYEEVLWWFLARLFGKMLIVGRVKWLKNEEAIGEVFGYGIFMGADVL